MNEWGKWIRRGAAVVIMVSAIILAVRNPVGVLWAIPMFALFAILMMPELVRPFTFVVDWLLGTMPGSNEKPPLDLRLARHYVKEERYEDALAEYLRVMSHHPGVVETYVKVMEMIAELGGNMRELDAVYQKGQRKLTSPGDLEELKDAYEEARMKLNAYRDDSSEVPA